MSLYVSIRSNRKIIDAIFLCDKRYFSYMYIKNKNKNRYRIRNQLSTIDPPIETPLITRNIFNTLYKLCVKAIIIYFY